MAKKKAKVTERAINERALDIIKESETLELETYRCPAGVLTIGWGHTGREAYEGNRITKKRADELLLEDIREAAQAVQRLVKVPLADNQFSALVSFVYNIGQGHFQESTLLRKLNAGQRCVDEFDRWVRSKGKVLPGLVTRRQKERRLFESK